MRTILPETEISLKVEEIDCVKLVSRNIFDEDGNIIGEKSTDEWINERRELMDNSVFLAIVNVGGREQRHQSQYFSNTNPHNREIAFGVMMANIARNVLHQFSKEYESEKFVIV